MTTTTSVMALDQADIKYIISESKEIIAEVRQDEQVALYCSFFMGLCSIVQVLVFRLVLLLF